MTRKNIHYYLAVAVALMTLLIYLPALRDGFVNWDDDTYILENPYIRSFNLAFFKWSFLDFYAANWHPLTWMSHALDYALWGLNPLGHHLTSIILHAVNTFLLVLLLQRLLSLPKETARIKEPSAFLHERTILIAAGITGLLFGLHPVHVESVVWVAERKDLLCALFFLLSISMYTESVRSQELVVRSQKSGGRSNQSGDSTNDEAGQRSYFINKHYLLTFGFFILALLSKPMAVSLPVVLLILEWYPLNRIRSWKTLRTACGEKLPFIALSLISSILTILAQRSGDALQSMDFAPLSTRVLVAAKALIAYLEKLIWPLNLIPFYPYPQDIAPFSLEYLLPIVLVIVITIICLLLIDRQRVWLSVWGYYVVTLIPVLGIVQVGIQSMADRYTYLPGIGPFFIMGLVAAWAWSKVNALTTFGLPIKIVGLAVVILVCISLLSITLRQIDIWKGGLELWTYVIERDPGIPRAYNNRGLMYVDRDQFDKAKDDFDQAIALEPTWYAAYNNRGMLYGRTGRFDNAIADFEKTITLNPSFFMVYNNLGILYAKTGLFNKAFEQFNKAIMLNQEHAMAYYNRGLLYLRTGNKELAVSDYQKACYRGNDNACSALKLLSQGLHSE